MGGMGNSLRRIGTRVLRLCFTEDKDMVKVKGQGVNVCVCIRAGTSQVPLERV